MAARAFEFGITRERLTGDLARYIDHEYNKHKVATNIRLYADKVFLFEGVKLITVFSIPRTLLRAYRKIVAREEAA